MSKITFLPKDAARLGEYVRQLDHGQVGRVYAIQLGPTESEYWQELNHITAEEKNEHWYSVLCFPGGSVTGPVSRFEKIEPIPNFHEQRDAADYFRDCVLEHVTYSDMNERMKELGV